MLSVRASLLIGLLLSGVLVGSAGAAPVSEMTQTVSAAEAENLFTTTGITEEATQGQGRDLPARDPYSLPAEEMPPSKTVGPAPDDTGRQSRCGCQTRAATRRTSPRCGVRR